MNTKAEHDLTLANEQEDQLDLLIVTATEAAVTAAGNLMRRALGLPDDPKEVAKAFFNDDTLRVIRGLLRLYIAAEKADLAQRGVYVVKHLSLQDNQYGFLHQGVWITDPTTSTCGRFQEDPFAEYGLTVDQYALMRAANPEFEYGK